MTILRIYSIFDLKAEAYLTPFFLPTDAMALRTFTDCVHDPTHAFGIHPEDYVLFCFGTFSISPGDFELLTVPVIVSKGFDILHIAPDGTVDPEGVLASKAQILDDMISGEKDASLGPRVVFGRGGDGNNGGSS